MTAAADARLSIAVYKPKDGKQTELLALVQKHVPYLRSIGLATERPHIVAKASDGAVLEIFEWVEDGIEKAHSHAGLREMWMQYGALCDYVPLTTLSEAHMQFANFVPVN